MSEHHMTISITQKMFGWTKWGGAREGMYKEDLDTWYCQVCGEEQLKVLPCYMFPVDGSEREFVRVCSLCKAEAILKKLREWIELKRDS